MLKDANAAFTYREYTKDPLTADELREVLGQLGMTVHDVLRPRDAAKHGFSAKDSADVLIEAIAVHPRMLQRPIGIRNGRAELGRPPENLLRLVQ